MNTDRATALDSLMHAVLLRLELASHIGASSTDGDKVSHGKASAKQPPRVSPAYLNLRRDYDRCRSDAARREVIGEALKELRSLRYAKHKREQDSRELRLAIGLDPRGATAVAEIYGCNRQHVYRLRAEAKQASKAAGGIPRSVRREARL